MQPKLIVRQKGVSGAAVVADKVPVLFLESDLVKKVWRFIEQLQSFNGIEEDIVNINLLDIQNKKRIDVMIDCEDKKYLSVNSSRTEEA